MSHFAAQAPTQRGLGDRKDATSDKAGPSGAAREVRERLFSVRGVFLAALGRPGSSKRGPGTPKASKRNSKVSLDGSNSGAGDDIF